MVERQHSASAYRAFLDVYPFGDHADQARVTLASLATSSNLDDKGIDLPKPPQASDASASSATDNVDKPNESSEAIEKAWDVLKQSRDQEVVGRFAKKFPSLRHNRLPPGSDFGLRPVDSTEWMLKTAEDTDVNRCFAGEPEACLTAIEKYPDYVQLRFQLCRVLRHPKDCMIDAVEDARARGYLVSAFTRSAEEEARNQQYRAAVSQVQQNVGNIVGDTVNNVVNNIVGGAVGVVAGPAIANVAGGAGGVPAPQLLVVPNVRWTVRLGSIKAALASGGGSTTKATVITPTITTTNTSKLFTPGSNGAGTAATNAATKASSSASSNASKAATNAATNAASKAAFSAANKAAAAAASNAASRAAFHAAGRAASNAAANAASKAASNAAAKAASNAASNAASRINIPSDIRLKRDIVPLGRTTNGLQLYRYRYIGDDTFYVGVMAQEVAERVPDAVTRGADGYLMVDYGKLGLTFMTSEEWSRRNASNAKN
jgi:hypothetical protein